MHSILTYKIENNHNVQYVELYDCVSEGPQGVSPGRQFGLFLRPHRGQARIAPGRSRVAAPQTFADGDRERKAHGTPPASDVGCRVKPRQPFGRVNGEVLQLPSREFLVEVTYVIRTRHLVRAASAAEAEHLAPDAVLIGEVEVVDIVGAVTLR